MDSMDSSTEVLSSGVSDVKFAKMRSAHYKICGNEEVFSEIYVEFLQSPA